MKATTCSLVENDTTYSALDHSIRQITKSIYSQIAKEAQKINSTFYIGDELDMAIFESLKPIIKNVTNRINKIIEYGVTSAQNMAKRYQEGVRRVNFTGNVTKEATKTFKIKPSKGFYRIPQNVYDTPKWYKLAMNRLQNDS